MVSPPAAPLHFNLFCTHCWLIYPQPHSHHSSFLLPIEKKKSLIFPIQDLSDLFPILTSLLQCSQWIAFFTIALYSPYVPKMMCPRPSSSLCLSLSLSLSHSLSFYLSTSISQLYFLSDCSVLRSLSPCSCKITASGFEDHVLPRQIQWRRGMPVSW